MYKRQGTGIGRISYILSVFVPFVFLFYYKYSTFFLHGIMPDMPEITLPIGISFYTFQLVSYCIDVHYGRAARQKKLVNLIAVSYTHLDVYKRQAATPFIGRMVESSLKEVDGGVIEAAPVSYTHLDVYKRQIPC